MKIWVNTIVHNEENFIWFTLMSVVDYVDKMLIWDTGSTDKTVDIIKEIKKIKGKKIEFREIGPVDKEQFTKSRQEMLDQSNSDWILILDGDEVWWNNSIKKLKNTIEKKGQDIEGIVVPMKVAVGDIYHTQEEIAGDYQLLGKKGHLSLKAFSKKIPGLHVKFPYGQEGFFDNENIPIQEGEDIFFLNAPFLHLTHLKRSSQKRRFNKFKYEIGDNVSENFKFPEVFYKKFPSIVSSPWVRISGMDLTAAKFLTPLRKIKRRIS